MKDKLSIYRVAPADTSARQLAPPGRQNIDLQGFRFSASPYAGALRTGRHFVEVAQASGTIGAAGRTRMGNTEVQAGLPSDGDAVLDSEKEMS